MKAGSYCFQCQTIDCEQHQRPVISFTPRQLQILCMLVKPNLAGHKQIAFAMGITEGTLKVYLSRLYEKLRAEGVGSEIRILTLWVVAHAQLLGASVPSPEDFLRAA